MPNSKEIYIRVWRTAFERGKLELTYPTHAECVKMRLNLYRAVKDFRKIESSSDPGFTRMIEKMEMVIVSKEDGYNLVIRDKSQNPLVLEASRALDSLKGES